MEEEGSRQYVDDGYGGLVDVSDMRPVMRVGKPEPVAYIDHMGRVYLVGGPSLAQYMECLVEYDYDFSRDLTGKI